MLEEIFHVLKKRFLIEFLVFWVVLVIVAIATFSRQPMYQATTGIILKDERLINNAFNVFSDALFLKTAQKLFLIDEKTDIQEQKRIIDFFNQSIDVHIDESLALLKIIAIAPEAEQAVLLADTHAQSFVQSIVSEVSDQEVFIPHAFNKLKDKLTSMNDTKLIQATEQKLVRRLEKAQNDKKYLLKSLSQKHPRIIMLDRSIEDLRALVNIARKQKEFVLDYSYTLEKISREKNVVPGKNMYEKFIIPAELPQRAFLPHMKNHLIVGLLIALLLSVISAHVVEYLDTSLGTYPEVESYLHIPVVGSIPHIERRTLTTSFQIQSLWIKRKRDVLGEQRSRLLFFQPMQSLVSERYQELLDSLAISNDEENKIIALVSAENREGKSITSANLAITSAFAGIKTLLIDGNMRLPVMHLWFGLPQVPGLTDLIIHSALVSQVIIPGDSCRCTTAQSHNNLLKAGLSNLSLLTAGTTVTHPELLFKKKRLSVLLNTVKKEFGVVIIDTPAVLHGQESLALSACADTVIFVYRSGRLSRGLMKEAVSIMQKQKIAVNGLIINDGV